MPLLKRLILRECLPSTLGQITASTPELDEPAARVHTEEVFRYRTFSASGSVSKASEVRVLSGLTTGVEQMTWHQLRDVANFLAAATAYGPRPVGRSSDA